MKTAVKGESKQIGYSTDMVVFTRPEGLKGPAVKHLSVLARRHMISVGVGLPNQPVGLGELRQLVYRLRSGLFALVYRRHDVRSSGAPRRRPG